MRIKYFSVIKSFLKTQYNHWILFPAVLGPLLLIANLMEWTVKPELFGWFLCGLYSFVAHYFFVRIKKVWGYVACHVILLLSIPAISSLLNQQYVIYFICCCAYFEYYLYRRLKGGKLSELGLLPFGVSIAGSCLSILILHSIGYTCFDLYFFTLNVILAGCYLGISFLNHFAIMMQANEESAGNFPGKEIFRTGLKMLLCYGGLASIFFAIFSDFTLLSKFFALLRQISFSMLKIVINFLFPKEPEQELLEEVPLLQNNKAFMIPIGARNEFFDKFEKFFLIFIYILFIYLGFLLLKKIFLSLAYMIKHYLPSKKEDNIEYTVGDVREKCVKQRTRAVKKRLGHLFLTASEKIRKMYQRKVLSDRKYRDTSENVIFQKITAREYGQISGNMTLSELYEKARYSDKVCDNNDVKKMKEVCK